MFSVKLAVEYVPSVHSTLSWQLYVFALMTTSILADIPGIDTSVNADTLRDLKLIIDVNIARGSVRIQKAKLILVFNYDS